MGIRSIATIAALLSLLAGAVWASEPSDPRVEAHLDAADAHYDSGDYAAAVREYDAAIAIEGRSGRLLALRGGARFRLGDFKGAESDLTGALKLDPDDAELLLLRGLSRSLLEPPDRKGTCADFERARRLGRDIRDVAAGVGEWCGSEKS